jgi:WD40 repeat protein
MGPLAWSPDGQRLASGDSNAIIHLWTNDGRTSQLLKGHEGIVSALAWSADGQRLASGGWDKTVRLWSAEGVTGPVLQGHQDTVSAVAWHPDGMQLASASLDETVRFWEVSGTAGDVIEVAKGRAQFQSICWSPNGELLATGGSWGVELWQRDGKPGRSLNGPIENTPAVAWSPDSRCLASGHESGKVLLWRPDATSGSVLRGHMGLVNALAWPGNGRLISGDLGGTLRMWNVETGTTEWTAICLKENRHVTFSPTGEILHGHPKVIEEELVYLVEPPDGPIELLKPSEFKKRAGR